MLFRSKYTTTAPSAEWFAPKFDDGGWSTGQGGFGVKNNHFEQVGTEWKTPDIWLRRTFELPATTLGNPYLRIYHDDDARVYVNGQLIAEVPGSNQSYAYVPFTPAARAALRRGTNTLAVHAHQNRGGQFIDVGIVDVADGK